ncbi:phosphate acyltransferase [Salinispira pacifica]|uniref:Phosphate acetyltransferase n=1 Tax=Salinispira pacifica TaxID=1307761 RepID=V5WDH6_9SPIO|nr:phosphate acyltransferase [Salinispira pacifica]AHC13842.1 Phosphate acetyltransferase [Salinispira pacifica]
MRLEEFFVPPVKRRVAVPFPYEPALLETTSAAAVEGWAEFLFIGETAKIEELASAAGMDPGHYRCIESTREDEACSLAAEALRDGLADLAMKGAVHTANFSRAIFYKEYGLVEPGRLASHIGACELPGFKKILFLTDCAINISPDYDDKLIILKNALETLRGLGVKVPKVALVAPVETVNRKIPATVDADRMVQDYNEGLLTEELGPAVIEGPFGLDVALSAEAARTKGIESRVAGDADILLFPDLNTGNAVYKAFTYAAGGTIAGNLIGPRSPVVLTSRADDNRTKLLSLKMGVSLIPPA